MGYADIGPEYVFSNGRFCFVEIASRLHPRFNGYLKRNGLTDSEPEACARAHVDYINETLLPREKRREFVELISDTYTNSGGC